MSVTVELPKMEPKVVIERVGGSYHVNVMWDAWESHVGVYWFKSSADRAARKALRKKLAEYSGERSAQVTLTKEDL